jgi:hypothetical protein
MYLYKITQIYDVTRTFDHIIHHIDMRTFVYVLIFMFAATIASEVIASNEVQEKRNISLDKMVCVSDRQCYTNDKCSKGTCYRNSCTYSVMGGTCAIDAHCVDWQICKNCECVDR